ncbi:hypothetical protein [Lapillicoccus sp.]|uniref:hypothetical protein n=1 Tax=Lapillicoccus sp. TaxID=1909287 RepID=UPI00326670AD
MTQLRRRRSLTAAPDWHTRLLVVRTTAFRVWLDDLTDGVAGLDPVAHLREILAERDSRLDA